MVRVSTLDRLVAGPRSSRRTFLAGAGTLAGVMTAGALRVTPGAAQTPSASGELLTEVVIDLAGVPESIDPGLAYSPRDWSIVHAIYDAPVTISDDGTIVPLAAESFTAIDATSWEVRLLPDMTFHDGSPVTSAALVRSLEHILASESDAAGLFAVVSSIDVIDDLTCRIVTSEPAPWLPAQIAVYMVLLPEIDDPTLFLTNPVGSGPYRYESQESGSSITLVRNPDWKSTGAKGQPIAERVTYRFVPEPATRIADLASGSAGIITEIPHDQMQAITDAGATPVEASVVGSHFIRVASDIEPFNLPEVRQALNLAIDAESIAQALVSPEAHRLASLFPDPRALGFDAALTPFPYDPDRARELLSSVGMESISTVLEVTTGARLDIAEAIVAQLADVGMQNSVTVSDYATFNGAWSSPDAPPLRLVTWAPLFDPQSLLALVFASTGFLSRFDSPEVDELIAIGAAETDPAQRQATYQELARVMQESAPAVFLWNLTSGYGVASDIQSWTPRGDDYVLPLSPGSPA